ncbi:MAG TPA: cupredoxin domain-containing protein [Gaiellaceae bacterium]|nr:cupredoxin domain-containing protein [Gaiellaceae bacterium]
MIAALSAFRRGARAAPATRVRVRGGYHPDTVYGRVGEPLRIVFRREESAACSEQVVFPEFGKSAMLPPYEDVTVELRPERAGEYEFTCQMGMLHGRLIVADGPSTAPGRSR